MATTIKTIQADGGQTSVDIGGDVVWDAEKLKSIEKILLPVGSGEGKEGEVGTSIQDIVGTRVITFADGSTLTLQDFNDLPEDQQPKITTSGGEKPGSPAGESKVRVIWDNGKDEWVDVDGNEVWNYDKVISMRILYRYAGEVTDAMIGDDLVLFFRDGTSLTLENWKEAVEKGLVSLQDQPTETTQAIEISIDSISLLDVGLDVDDLELRELEAIDLNLDSYAPLPFSIAALEGLGLPFEKEEETTLDQLVRDGDGEPGFDPNVSISVGDKSGNEGEGVSVLGESSTLAFTIGGVTNVPVTVPYTVFARATDTAEKGTDFVAASGSVDVAGNFTQDIKVHVHEDHLVEGNETFSIVLGFAVDGSGREYGYQSASDRTATFTIEDNDLATLSIEDVYVDESAGTATITVRMDNPVDEAVTVNYMTGALSPPVSGRNADAGIDYTAQTGSFVFDASSNLGVHTERVTDPSDPTGNYSITQTIIIPISDTDLSFEGDEGFQITLSLDPLTATASGRAIAIGDATARVSIVEDVVPIANLSVTTQGAENNAGAPTDVELRVDLVDGTGAAIINGTGGTLSFDLALANGSAVVGTDLVDASGVGVITIADGASFGTVTITLTEDAIVEADVETFTATISNVTNSATQLNAANIQIGTGTVTANITDDDTAAVTIGDVTVNEEAGTITFTLTADTAVDGGFSLDVDITAAGAGDGDVGAEAADLSIATQRIGFAGTAGETQIIVIPINNEAIVEGDETFTVSMSNTVAPLANIADIDVTDTATGTITNTDTTAVTIEDVVVSENDGTATITLALSNGVEGGFDVNVDFANVTTSNADFATASQTVSFAGTKGETQTITVDLTDDMIVEALAETATVSLSTIANLNAVIDPADIVITDTATLTILDTGDSAAVTIADISVDEDAGNVVVTLTLNTAVDGGFDVDVVGNDGTAEATDYTGAPVTATFAGTAGETQTVLIPITADTIVEGSEAFTTSLTNLVTGAAPSTSVDISDTGTVTITETDQAAVTIEDVAVNEEAGTITFTLTADNAVEGGFAVDVDIATAGAGNGDVGAEAADLAVATQRVEFVGAAGETQTVVVPINDEAIVEGDETFTVSMSNVVAGTAPSGNIIITDTATGTITNTDTTAVTIADVMVNENDGTATITLALSAGVEGGFDVDVDFANVTTSNADLATASQTVSFAGTNGEIQTITVALTDDMIVEALAETATVSLSNIANLNAAISAGDIDITDTATLTVLDDDSASVTIGNVSVDEDAGTATVTLTLDNAVVGGFDVDVVGNNATAETADYTGAAVTATFAGTAGETQDVVIPITADDIVEGSEAFVTTLTNLVMNGAASATSVDITDSGTVTITEADAAAVTIDDVTIDEEAGTATIVVSLDNAVEGGFSVDADFTGVTATAGDDFAGATQRLQFVGTAGETQSIVVPIADDDFLEIDETFTVSLSNLTTGGTVSGASVDVTDTATVTITNTDLNLNPFVASVSIADVSVDEDAGVATVTLTLDNAVGGTFDVDVVGNDGTAEAADYTGAAVTATFVGNAGETQTVDIPITADDIVEGSEAFTVSLTNLLPTGFVATDLNISDTGTVTITETDTASLAIGNIVTGGEEGTLSFDVVLTGNVEGGFSVDIDRVVADAAPFTGAQAFGAGDGDRLAEADDIGALLRTLDFQGTDGETVTVTVSQRDDAVLEVSDENFTVALNNVVLNVASPVWTAATNTPVVLPTTATTLITGNDLDATAVTIEDVTVNEGDGTATITLALSNGVEGGFTARVFFADQSTSPGDFDHAIQDVNFAGTTGETQTITVALTDDMLVEAAAETVRVEILEITNLGPGIDDSAININDFAILTILDNDSAAVTIADISVDEDAGTVSVELTLNTAVDGGFDVDVVGNDGTAEATDYTGTAVTATFAGTAGETQTVLIPITADTIVEGSEAFTTSLTNLVMNGAAPSTSVDISDTGTVTITETDQAAVTIEDVAVNEEAGTITFTLTADNAVEGGFAVDVDIATAGAGNGDVGAEAADLAVATQRVEFVGAAGETQTVVVPINDEAIVEGDETFTVSMSNVVAGTAPSGNIIITDTATGTITNTDTTAVTIADVMVNENDGTATITLALSAGVEGGFDVDVDFANVTTSNADLATASQTVSFAGTNGETQTITVALTDDMIVEAIAETATVSLSNITNLNAAIDAGDIDITDTATLTVFDDDAANVTIADVSVDENAGTVTVTLTLDNAVDGGFKVDVVGNDGTAVAADYTGTAVTAAFAGTAGEVQTVVMPITSDLLLEPSETFVTSMTNLAMSGAAPVTSVNIADTGVVTINDTTTANATFSVTDGAEGGAPVVFTITLDKANLTGQDITFDLADTSTGSGTSGADYTAIPVGTQIVIAHGETTGSFVVPVIDDGVFELAETVEAQISNPSLGRVSIAGLDTLSGAIADNDINIVRVRAATPEERAVEVPPTPDTDGDGIADSVDADPDGDPSTPNGPDLDGDGILDTADADVNGNGVDDNVDVDAVGGANFGGPDADGDNIVDGADADLDGDGIVNGADANPDGLAATPDVGADVDNDDILDTMDPDLNGNRIDDNADVSLTGGVDIDSDGIDDAFDIDTDGDNLPDVAGNFDLDHDGIIDNGGVDIDTNGDGLIDATAPADLDADNDGVLNAADTLDNNGNGISDPADPGLTPTSTVSFVVELSKANNTGSPITVAYTVSGTATSGLDFAALSGTVLIGDGAQTATIDVGILDDGIFDSAAQETVILTIDSITHGDATVTSRLSVDANNNSATVGIIDNEPVIIDLDGDGIEIADSRVAFDIDGDGALESVVWAAPDDGFLVYDGNQDGQITERGEIVFTEHAAEAKTDLEAIQIAFDTDGDFVLTSNDAEWENFAIWQDLNSNGITDAGELVSLDAAGVRSIGLLTDGHEYDAAFGAHVFGESLLTYEDGSTARVADTSLTSFDGNGGGDGGSPAASEILSGQDLLNLGESEQSTAEVASENAAQVASNGEPGSAPSPSSGGGGEAAAVVEAAPVIHDDAPADAPPAVVA